MTWSANTNVCNFNRTGNTFTRRKVFFHVLTVSCAIEPRNFEHRTKSAHYTNSPHHEVQNIELLYAQASGHREANSIVARRGRHCN